MYVVRRAFRNLNQMMVPGSEIEPGTVKLFKTRLRERQIIEVSEQDFDKWNEYFLKKYGTPIKRLEANAEEANAEEAKTDEVKTEEAKTDEAKTEEVKTEEVKAKPAAKAVAKAVAK